MGTHPIFESDFDCLTDAHTCANLKYEVCATQSGDSGHYGERSR